ncbi:hypothetical protein ABGB07_39980 [Micromonosporaceae bacterium B7E4]
MDDVQIWWVGLACMQRQDDPDQVFGSLQVVTADMQPRQPIPFPPDRDFYTLGDEGQRLAEVSIPVYSGPVQDVGVMLTLIEHDSGDVSAEKKLISQAISAAATAALTSATGPGGILAKPLIDVVAGAVVKIGVDVLGLGDDPYPPAASTFTRDMILSANERRKPYKHPHDPKTITSTDIVNVSGKDQGDDIGQYHFHFDVRLSTSPSPPGQPQPNQPQPNQPQPNQPQPTGPGAPADVVVALNRMGVDFSVEEGALRSWLANSTFTPYPAIAQALLNMGRTLTAPVYLDVVVWNYEHTPGVASPRDLAGVRDDVLKAAVLEAYNVRHGQQVKDFAQILKP